MIFTIKGEIVKQQTEEDFRQIGWCFAYNNRPSLYKVWWLESTTKARNYVKKQNNEASDDMKGKYHLMPLFIKKEETNE